MKRWFSAVVAFIRWDKCGGCLLSRPLSPLTSFLSSCSYELNLHQNSAWSKRLVSRVAVKSNLLWEFLCFEWPKILSHVRISRQPDDLCCSEPTSPRLYGTTSYDNFCNYIGTRFGEPLRLLDFGVLSGSRQAMSILYLAAGQNFLISVNHHADGHQDRFGLSRIESPWLFYILSFLFSMRYQILFVRIIPARRASQMPLFSLRGGYQVELKAQAWLSR